MGLNYATSCFSGISHDFYRPPSSSAWCPCYLAAAWCPCYLPAAAWSYGKLHAVAPNTAGRLNDSSSHMPRVSDAAYDCPKKYEAWVVLAVMMGDGGSRHLPGRCEAPMAMFYNKSHIISSFSMTFYNKSNVIFNICIPSYNSSHTYQFL